MWDLPSIKLFKEKYDQFFQAQMYMFLHGICNTIAVWIYFLLIEIHTVIEMKLK